MNKQELLDSAVHEFSGKWGSSKKHLFNCNNLGFIYSDNPMIHTHSWCANEFQQRARELGYVNGYRYGVEYPTDGKKPDLPDDVIIRYWAIERTSDEAKVASLNWLQNTDECHPIIKFKITDQRYKPADTSYLDSVSEITIISCQYIGGGSGGVGCVIETPESKSNAENVSEWYDYEAQKAVALPPVGANIEGYWHKDTHPKWNKAVVLYSSAEHLILRFADGEENYYHATDFEKHSAKLRPLDHATRKAEAEKKRVVDAAQKVCINFYSNDLSKLYDAGFLRMPTE